MAGKTGLVGDGTNESPGVVGNGTSTYYTNTNFYIWSSLRDKGVQVSPPINKANQIILDPVELSNSKIQMLV